MGTCPNCAMQYPENVHTCPLDGASIGPDEPELFAGAMVGEYRVEKKLGEGGFGTVYQVVHPVIGKAAALKVLSREFSSNPEMVTRFVSEARSVNQIRNKGIIDIFAFGALPSGRQYFVMELLEGLAYDRYLEDNGALPPAVGLPLLRSIARALDAAHAAGIVHRDLKPENVFLVFDDEGLTHTKLLDFGIAKYVGELPAGQHITNTGMPMGSPRYMSPEQCRGLPVDHHSDVYALGVMAFQTLTGKLPFVATTALDLLFQHANTPAPPPSSMAHELGKTFDEPILRMLAKTPAERPASAGEAIDALVAAPEAAGIGIPAGAPALPRPPPPRPAQIVPPELAETSPSVVPPLAPIPPTPGAPGSSSGALRQIPTAHSGKRLPGPVTQPDRPRSIVDDDSRPIPGATRAPLAVTAVGATVLLGLLGGGAWLWLRPAPPTPTPTPNPVPVVQPVVVPTPPTPVPPRVEPPESFKRVTVTVRCPVRGASVFLGAERLGAAGEALLLPYGTQPISLTVKAAGYQPLQLEATTRQDSTVDAPLKPLPQAPPKLNKDLEDPFH